MGDVSLRLLDAGDLDFLAAVSSDESTRRFTRIPEPPPDGFAARWLSAYEAGRADGTREAFVVADGDDVGLALAPSIERDAATAELGYLIAPHARGRGHATTALRLLSDWAFEELDLVRLELRIGTGNVASQAVARRAGYTHEGTLRSTHLKQGIREDTQIWSLLQSDPR
jgi:RimJ/RimL family protein N-acetyltransferase